MADSECADKENPEEEGTYTPPKDHTDDSNQPLPPTGMKSQSHPPVDEDTESQYAHKKRKDDIKLGLQIVGLVVLVAYTIFTGVMMLSTQQAADAAKTSADVAVATLNSSGITVNKTLAEMKRQSDAMRDNVDIALDGIKISKMSIDKAESRSRLDQRAWMGIESISGKPEVDKPFIISIKFKNSGDSPAKNAKIQTWNQIDKSDIPPRFDVVGQRIKGMDSTGIVAPGGHVISSIKVYSGEPITKTVFDSINNGERSVFVFGMLTYDDIFGQHHWITYCYCLTPGGDKYIAYKKHNDTDS